MIVERFREFLHPRNMTALLLLAGFLVVLSACSDPDENQSNALANQHTGDGDGDATGDGDGDATGDGDGEEPETVLLDGGVQKGPFVLGSTVNVSPVDSLGNPSGQTFPTQTNSDLGDFSVQFDYQGPVLLEAQGFYFNEAVGTLSEAQLTLRAFHEIDSGGDQQAYINILTHLTSNRVRTLLGDGMTMVDAVDAAEEEFREALGLGGDLLQLDTAGVDMNLLGGDDDGNAYLFALSAVLTHLAWIEGGVTADATLQEYINTVASVFANDGEITDAQLDRFNAAQADVNPFWVTRLMERRLEDLGSSAELPDLNRVLDSSGDGFPNRVDTCPMQSNPDQEIPDVGICHYQGFYLPLSTTRTGSEEIGIFRMENGNLLADYDKTLALHLGDLGSEDGETVFEDWEFALVPIDEEGRPGDSQSISLTFPGSDQPQEFYFEMTVADVSGNGFDDIVLFRGSAETDLWPEAAMVFENDGAGEFSYLGPRVDMDALEDKASEEQDDDFGFGSVERCNLLLNARAALVADLTHDGKKELLLRVGGCKVLLFEDEEGIWGQPLVLVEADERATTMATVDFSGDGNLELLGVINEEGERQLVRFEQNGEEGAFSREVLFTMGPEATGPLNVPEPMTGDFSGDGELEILLRAEPQASWQVLALDQDGNYEEVATLSSSLQIRGVTDFTGDGRAELLDSDGGIWMWHQGAFVDGGGLLERPPASFINRMTTVGNCVVGSYGRYQPFEMGLQVECVE